MPDPEIHIDFDDPSKYEDLTHVRAVKAFLADHKDRLLAAGIKAIVVTYTGSGDSGYVESINAYSDLDKAISQDVSDTCPSLFSVLPEPIIHVFEGLEPRDGYENGDGGGGHMVCEVETGKITNYEFDFVLETYEHPPKEITNQNDLIF